MKKDPKKTKAKYKKKSTNRRITDVAKSEV
jgi:hypothetical protein